MGPNIKACVVLLLLATLLSACGKTDNVAPVANAGSAQTVFTAAVTTLDGGASFDPDGQAITYTWSFSSRPVGSSATLSDTHAVHPTFTADVGGTYVAQLIVSDGALDSAAATVNIVAAVSNVAPVANAGPAQSVTTGDLVTLNGSASSDADANPLTYTWSFTSRPASSTASFSDASAVQPTFTADLPGSYVVRLVVNDGTVNSAAATVTITAATVTDLVVNGSFEADLANWSQGTVIGAGASGTCSFNAAVAPGTETLTSVAGFPATDGTKIALGSVTSTTGAGGPGLPVYNCALYQDIAIPLGTTSLVLTYDVAVTGGNDGIDTGLFVGLFSTAAVPGITSQPVGGPVIRLITATPGTALAAVTDTLNVSGLAGTTVRLGFINAAERLAHEVVALDHVKLTARITQ
jgi:hypothetical protein